jgi:excinuclease UvrABC nuclease subunit
MTRTQLYRHYDAQGALLYVGIAIDAGPRLKKHPWAKAVVRSAIAVFQTREEAAAAEAKAIRAERPKYNVVHLPKDDRRHQHSMNAKEYSAAIKQMGLSQVKAAKWLGIGIRTSHGYANGELIPEYIAKLLRLCVKLKLNPEDVK